MRQLLKTTLLLAVTFFFSISVSAQAPIKKPEKKQQATTTTKPKPNTNKGSQTKQTTGYINGHEWVDLGLSVKWATCNVGASSPSDYGNYYAWGETSTKSEYTKNNSKTYGKNVGYIAGRSAFDVARSNWGSTWRLPTVNELDDLLSKCEWLWTSQEGSEGYRVTGHNGNSIFLPAAGWRDGTALNYAGKNGYYWSATPGEDHENNSYYLCFDNGNCDRYWCGCYFGMSVRPISE